MNRTLYFHTAYPGKGKKGVRITVAGILQEDGTMKFGVARCTAEDNFCRAKGRELAEPRAKSDTEYYAKVPVTVKEDELIKWFAKAAKVIGDIALSLNSKCVNKPFIP